MKKSALWGLALTVASAAGLQAQGLTMQMSNGWAFSFSGNVNAFLVYTKGSVDTSNPFTGTAITGGLVGADEVSRIRTGLLPGFATFEARGKEAGLDLAVHFGFAPQINSNSLHDNFGAQIDMRQVYLTAGGTWGQILAGREIGLYQRQNILTDMTLSGTGASGGTLGAGGTTLGRIGFGYIYPNFNAQITYSTPANKPAQLSIGLFDPSVICPEEGCGSAATAAYQGTKLPRVEAEFVWKGAFGAPPAEGQPAADQVMFWVSGMVQKTDATAAADAPTNPSITSTGVAGGLKLDVSGFSILGSGYYGDGIGTTLMFGQLGGAIDSTGAKRKSYGYIGQITYSPVGTKWMLGASYGDSRLKTTDADPADANFNTLVKSNRSIDGLISYQFTKSLRWVGEYTWAKSEAFSGAAIKSNQGATGLMLFF